MNSIMQGLDLFQCLLIICGTLAMAVVLLRGIGDGAVAVAAVAVVERRADEERRTADNVAAEAAGKAAMLEPLTLKSDGTIEEPIIGVVEAR